MCIPLVLFLHVQSENVLHVLVDFIEVGADSCTLSYQGLINPRYLPLQMAKFRSIGVVLTELDATTMALRTILTKALCDRGPVTGKRCRGGSSSSSSTAHCLFLAAT